MQAGLGQSQPAHPPQPVAALARPEHLLDPAANPPDLGGQPKVVQTGTWGGEAALARLQAWNAEVRRVRCRIEKVFGTWKRSYGLRRMRWLGLAKAGLQVRLAAMAYNLRRAVTLLQGAAA